MNELKEMLSEKKLEYIEAEVSVIRIDAKDIICSSTPKEENQTGEDAVY